MGAIFGQETEKFACANCTVMTERVKGSGQVECTFCQVIGERSLIRLIRQGASR